jgi:hypothetical protein
MEQQEHTDCVVLDRAFVCMSRDNNQREGETKWLYCHSLEAFFAYNLAHLNKEAQPIGNR